MKWTPRRSLSRIVLVSAILTGIAACSSNTDDTAESDRVYLSHLDQARFYQEQGQYKAALQEAQSAIQAKPGQREPYLIVSRIFLDSGDAQRAAQYYRELIEVNPEGASETELNEARLGLAEALATLGKYDEAQEALKGLSHPSKADEIRMLTLQAQWALRQNQLEQAESLAREVLKRDPGDAAALIVLSRIEWGRKSPENAHAYLKKALESAPTHIEVLTWNAQLADLEKRWADAEDAYVALLDQVGSVDVMTPRKFTAISRLIEVLRAQGKHSEAFAYQEQLDKSAPGTVRNLYATALTAYEKGDLETAERNLTKLLDMAPGYKQAGILMGMVKVRQGDWQAADEYLSRYADPSSDPVAITKALATTKLKLNQYEQAELLLRQVDDKDTDILALMGIASAHTGNTSEAILNLEAALRQNPTDELRKQLAQVYIQDRQATKALSLIDQLQDTGEWDITGLRVSALASLARFDEAETHVRRWLKAHPDSAQGYNALGALYSQQKKWRDADIAYQKAIELDPANLPAWHNRIKNLQLQGDWASVLSIAEKGLLKHPDDLSLLRSYVRAAAKTDQTAAQTDARLTEIARQTGRVTPMLPVITRAIQLGEFERGKSLIEEARKLGGNTETLDEAAFRLNVEHIGRLLKDKNYDEALGIAESTLNAFPNKLGPWLLKARILAASGKRDDAFLVLRQAKERFPHESAPYELEGDLLVESKEFTKAADAYQLGWYEKPSQTLAIKMYQVLKAANKPEEAVSKLEAWLTKDPQSPQALTLLAMNHQSQGRLDEARRLYEQVIKLRPNDAVALNNLAWIYQELGTGDALGMARKAWDLLPDNAAIADTYGYILLKQGKAEQARKILQKAHDAAPEVKEIALHLAEALEKTGDPSAAQALRSKFN